MVEIRNNKDLEKWLENKPQTWAVAIAARAALRVLPLDSNNFTEPSFQPLFDEIDGYRITDSFLPLFRSNLISFTAAKLPNLNLIDLARDAAPSSSKSIAQYAVRCVASRNKTAAIARAGSTVARSAEMAGSLLATKSNPEGVWAHNRIWEATQIDIFDLEQGRDIFLRRPLWDDIPESIGAIWENFSGLLQRSGPDWLVWIDWYNDILNGEIWAASRGRPSIPELQTDLVQISAKDWRQGSKHINSVIKGLERKYWGAWEKLDSSRDSQRPTIPTSEAIASVASPDARLNSDDQLDIAPNRKIDQADNSDDVFELPEILLSLAGVLGKAIPENAPTGLRLALDAYGAELERRKPRPILGILTAQFAIIHAERHHSEADLWLPPGQIAGFNEFEQSHNRLVRHYPRLKEREKVLASIPVDPTKAVGEAFIAPFQQAYDLALRAKSDGVATDDFLRVFEILNDNAKAAAYLPDNVDVPNVKVMPDDRINPQIATPKQRLIGTALGLLINTYNLLGTSVTLVSTDYPKLAENLHKIILVLRSLFGA